MKKNLISVALFLILLSSCTSVINNSEMTQFPDEGGVESMTPTKISLPTNTITPEPVFTSTVISSPTPERIPPGQYLLFTRGSEGYLYALPMDEGEPILLLEYCPVFISTEGHFAVWRKDADFYVVDLVSGETNKRASFEGCGGVFGVSPNAEKVAAICNNDLYILSMQRDDPKILTNWEHERIEYLDPRWSPDGQYVAFWYKTTPFHPSPSSGLYITDIECLKTGKSCWYSTKGPYISGYIASYSQVSWAPDGKYLAILDTGDGFFYILNIDTGEVTLFLELYELVRGLAWSPDGEYIAYSTRYKIYLVNINDKKPEPIVLRNEEDTDIAGWMVVEP